MFAKSRPLYSPNSNIRGVNVKNKTKQNKLKTQKQKQTLNS